MQSRFQGGFTLIEIMIVISIIAVISSFALPQLEEARRSAREADAVSMARAIFNSQQQFKTREEKPTTPTPGGFAYHLLDLKRVGLLPAKLEQQTATVYAAGSYEFMCYGGIQGHPIPELQQLFIIVRPKNQEAGVYRSFLMVESGNIYYRPDGGTFILGEQGLPLGG